MSAHGESDELLARRGGRAAAHHGAAGLRARDILRINDRK